MPAQPLQPRAVERVWGRRDLPPGFPTLPGLPVGEIWFDGAADAPLLVKQLFTAEKLSVQVHPEGKDEAWFVLAAEPEAVIGLGLKQEVSRDALRAAALNGSLPQLLHWRPVRAGDFYYSPAGTIHAIGAGLSLIEVQQNFDRTLRLYDYGRPRPLQLDEALAIALREPWRRPFAPVVPEPGREILVAEGSFVLERRTCGGAINDDALVIPIADGGALDGRPLKAGSVWSVTGEASLAGDVDALVAHEGAEVRMVGAEAA